MAGCDTRLNIRSKWYSKLGIMSLLAIFFILIHLSFKYPNAKLPWTSLRLDMTLGITFLNNEDGNKSFNGECEFHEAKMERQKG
jgi:hypothetical protein